MDNKHDLRPRSEILRDIDATRAALNSIPLDIRTSVRGYISVRDEFERRRDQARANLAVADGQTCVWPKARGGDGRLEFGASLSGIVSPYSQTYHGAGSAIEYWASMMIMESDPILMESVALIEPLFERLVDLQDELAALDEHVLRTESRLRQDAEEAAQAAAEAARQKALASAEKAAKATRETLDALRK